MICSLFIQWYLFHSRVQILHNLLGIKALTVVYMKAITIVHGSNRCLVNFSENVFDGEFSHVQK